MTFAQVEQRVRELVAANPDFVYPKVEKIRRTYSCVYNPTEGQPACIFGQAFIDLGYPLPKSCEGNSIGEVMLDVLTGPVSDRDAYWADSLQIKQDNGKTWAVALQGADENREKYDEKHHNEEDDESDE